MTGQVRVYIIVNNTFKLLETDEEVMEFCEASLGMRQVVFHVQEKYGENHNVPLVNSSHGSGEDDYDEICDSDYSMGEDSDNDDTLYGTYVSKDVHDIIIPDSQGEESEEDDDVVHVDMYDFDEHKDSDGEQKDVKSFPVFNPEVTFEPEFELGMLFSSKDEFRDAVQSYAIRSRRTIKCTKTAPTRCYVKCDNVDCKWRISLLKQEDEESWQIRRFHRTHDCDDSFHVRNMKSKWLCKKFIKRFASDRNRKLKVFRQDAIDDLNVDISRDQAYRAKKLALKMLEGDPAAQFGKLWDYAEEIRRTNPGSTVIIGSVEDENGQSRFERCYICLDAVKKGFKNGCRPIIGIDGCHLKGPVPGIMLTAVGVDRNNNIYPLAWAVVNRESRELWEWFLVVLKQDLELHVDRDYTFMSDKQKGLIQAMAAIFPNSEHRFCVRHLHGNFQLAGFRGLRFKTALMKAAHASTVQEWKARMSELKHLNEAAWAWLNAKPPHQWSKSHFCEDSKCDMLLNNVCEVFYSTILEAREMPIITMLEWIRSWIMVRFQRHRDLATHKWKGKLCPRIKKKSLKNMLPKLVSAFQSREIIVIMRSDAMMGGQFVVELDDWTCSCRNWQLSGIPCSHAICAINHQKKKKEDYVHDCYTVHTFMKTYSETIKGINGQQLWGETMYIPPLPPHMDKGKGNKARRKGPDEKEDEKLKKHTKLKRKQTTVRCNVCGFEGHNCRTCDKNKVPDGDIPEEQSVHASMLPPISSQHPNVQSRPGPSMYEQLNHNKFKRQGEQIVASEKKFVRLADLNSKRSNKMC
ncbi:uncharacterized protein LOC131008435 [Salvia miltiorrhiza]|uniref:uncharacterized protein LOC131008435 n=1 Tax=Salvia miltiorrhiza TaxID=226208 RepID=UPI0025AC5DC3|nr:uncharacterized protein LOC131008435 [Salvia miltiorrhiza]